jgi:hypothetical protein
MILAGQTGPFDFPLSSLFGEMALPSLANATRVNEAGLRPPGARAHAYHVGGRMVIVHIAPD